MAAFKHSSTEKWFDCSIHSSLSHRRVFNQEQWNHSCCHRSYPVHCLSSCSLCCPLEMHGVPTATKAQEGESTDTTEEFCVNTGKHFASVKVADLHHIILRRRVRGDRGSQEDAAQEECPNGSKD